ncbi:hypothetical protein COU79_02475 [Candidatus Peregrinibacteria bacterium CG10_big_fil_rev_8_21_14_0_10_54_7]|nr:MAG: hypothetical protein COU79_02475 [Candidatus Peregrinibacteria bacterium CG10_big_fil_rev_8_21_14_0_10_54_7]
MILGVAAHYPKPFLQCVLACLSVLSFHLFPAKKVEPKRRRAKTSLPGPVPPHRLLQAFGADSSAPPYGRAFPFTLRGAPTIPPCFTSFQ